MKKRFLAGIMAFVMAVVMIPTSAFAATTQAKKVKMTVYNDVLKDGNTVYCSGMKGIYKVKLKKGKVKSVKVLVKERFVTDYMKKTGNYLYYGSDYAEVVGLNRVNISSGKIQIIGERDGYLWLDYWAYAIKGKKLYITYTDLEDRIRTEVMKLNGKSRKKASVKAVMKEKKSNADRKSVV